MTNTEYEEISILFSDAVSQMIKASKLSPVEKREITRKKNQLLRLIMKKLNIHSTPISLLVNQNEKYF